MSIEQFLADQQKNQRPTFKNVAGKLLAEREPNDSRPWKWEEEITEKDWEEMKKKLQEYKDEEDWSFFVELAFDMQMLKSDFNPEIDNKTSGFIRAALQDLYDYDQLHLYFPLLTKMHFLDPHYFLSQETQNRIELKMNKLVKTDEWTNFAVFAHSMYLLNPERKLSPKDPAWNGMKTHLRDLQQGKEWGIYARLAYLMRVLYPNEKNEFDERMWKYMEEELEINRKKILMAHKVEVTKDGILITDKPPAKLDVDIPPRPVRKKV